MAYESESVSADDKFLLSFSEGKILNEAFYMCIFNHIHARLRFIYDKSCHEDT